MLPSLSLNFNNLIFFAHVQVPTVYKIGLLKFFFYHAGFQIYFWNWIWSRNNFYDKKIKKEDRFNILHRIRWEANNDISLLRFVKSLYRFLFLSKIYSYKGG